ncbi:MAG: hypothetical protein JXB07_14725 [Anaerolineae bacterium]|nr:hypothetical protein [Anaerolineae bacterium]
MSLVIIWFLSVFVAATVIGLIALFLMKRSARPSAESAEVEAGPQQVTGWLMVTRLGLVSSIIALIIAIGLVPIANLPGEMSLPAFIYALLAFPVFVALGIVLSLLGYVFKRYRSSLAGLIVGGLSVVWLAASYLIRISMFER